VQKYKHLFIWGVFLFIFFILYIWLQNTLYFKYILKWAKNNKGLLITVIIFIKIIGIVWPPIPGALVSIAAIPILGWKLAYLSNLTGLIIGAVTAYKIAEMWGEKLVKKIIDLNTMKKIRIKKGREIELVILLTIFGGGAFFEAVCYAAGLLKIDIKKFLVGIIIGNALVGIPYYYIIDKAILLNMTLIAIILSLSIVFILYKLKIRYLEN